MSYESRILIVDNYMEGYCSIIADLHLSRIDESIINCFKKEVDFQIFSDGEEDLSVDKYGKKCTYCTIAELKTVLSGIDDTYRRHNLLKAVINQLVIDTSNRMYCDMNLKAVHYGY